MYASKSKSYVMCIGIFLLFLKIKSQVYSEEDDTHTHCKSVGSQKHINVYTLNASNEMRFNFLWTWTLAIVECTK